MCVLDAENSWKFLDLGDNHFCEELWRLILGKGWGVPGVVQQKERKCSGFLGFDGTDGMIWGPGGKWNKTEMPFVAVLVMCFSNHGLSGQLAKLKRQIYLERALVPVLTPRRCCLATDFLK